MQRLAHVLAAVVILLHGYSDLEKGHSMGWIFLGIGAAALVLGVMHHRLHARFPHIDGVFHLIEGITAVLIGIGYLHAGKVYLPYVSMAASIPYFVLGVRAFVRSGRAPSPETGA